MDPTPTPTPTTTTPVPESACSILLDPPGSTWQSLLAQHTAPPHAHTQAHPHAHPHAAQTNRSIRDATRQVLGLPANQPITMGGHQPGFWHAGILAKWIAVHAAAAQANAVPVWIVVDQSPGAGASLSYPARRDGHLTHSTLDLGESALPPAAQPPFSSSAQPTTPDAASDDVDNAIRRIFQLLGAHADEPTLARQLHASATSALKTAGFQPTAAADMHSIFATDLWRTPAFEVLLEAMRADPRSCAAFYNEAAAAHPHAGVRVLDAPAQGPVELPLWERTDPRQNTPWNHVTSERLKDLANDQIVLRGLPMTGLLRRWVCDLFIHGTGGGSSTSEQGYDRVTEQWFAAWLDKQPPSADHPPLPPCALAPAVVASATLRLEPTQLGLAAQSTLPTPNQIAQAQVALHRARHNPAMLSDTDAQRAKDELLATIATLPPKSTQRQKAYLHMHAIIAKAQTDHAQTLTQLARDAKNLVAQRNDARIASDRTWPWPMHTTRALAQLAQSLNHAFCMP